MQSVIVFYGLYSSNTFNKQNYQITTDKVCEYIKISHIFLLPFNGSIGIVQKIEFEIRPYLGCTTFKTSRKVVLDNPSVCLSVCASVCLAVAFAANSHGRKG